MKPNFRKSAISLFVPALLFAGLVVLAPERSRSQSQTTVQLQISRAATVPLKNPAATTIINAANQIIANCGVNCPFRLGAAPASIPTFAGLNSLDGPGDYSTLCDQAANIPDHVSVFVVFSINWCDVETSPAFGCSATPGHCVIVRLAFPEEKIAWNPDPLVWTHEVGHNRSLPHRNDQDAIMYPVASKLSAHFNAIECGLITRPTPPGPITGAPTAVRAANVRDFVNQLFIHGIAYPDAVHFNSRNDIQTLEGMLKSTEYRAAWTNAAFVLGAVGDKDEAAFLESFISQQKEAPSDEAHLRIQAALSGLGFILNKSGDERIVAYLANAASPSFWTSFRNPQSASPQNIDLRARAIMALGLSGNAAAAAQIESLRRSLGMDSKKFIFDEAAEANSAVKSLGLPDYFSRSRPRV